MSERVYKNGLEGKGAVLSFILSLKRELKFWKFAVLLLICAVIFLFFNNYSTFEEDIIHTKQIKHLKEDIIAEVSIDSVIFEDKERERMFEELIKSKHIKGLLVVINSPGGSPNASEILYNYLKTLAKKVPVIAFIKEVGASGGYMAALGANKIIAMPTSVVGSIGVRSGSRFDFSEVLKRLNVGYELYATSEYKSAGDVFQKITKKEKDYQMDAILQLMKVFKDMVSKERKLYGEKLERVANAKIFYAEKALNYGLIDLIGTKDDALSILRMEMNLGDIKLKEVQPNPKKVDNVFNKFTAFFSNILSEVSMPQVNTLTNL